MLSRILQFFKSELAIKRELLSLFVFAFTMFFYVALFSFHIKDPSPFSIILPAVKQLHNSAGVFGAFLSSTSIYYFGLIAFLLPLPFLYAVFRVYKPKPSDHKTFLIAGSLLAILAASTLLSKLYPQVALQEFLLPSSGILGSYLDRNLSFFLGNIGEWISIALMFFAGCILLWQRPLVESVFKFTKDTISNVKDSVIIEDMNAPQPLVATEIVPSPTPYFDIPMKEVIPESIEDFERPPMLQSIQKSSIPYHPPSALSIFKQSDPNRISLLQPKDFEQIAQLLVKTFTEFGVQGNIIGYQPGPVVTVYEFQPEAGVKQAKVFSLIDDIALALKVDSILIHPIAGKRALGVQVPNPKRETVYLGDILSADAFLKSHQPMTFAMGKSLSGQPVCADLATMPHLLCAGATGAGKSVAMNALICSLIMKSSPEDVRMILVDPKMLELSVYEGIPHLLMPVITEPDRASMALKWAAHEMERRYKIMQHAAVRHISGFNHFWETATETKRQSIKDVCQDQSIEKLPYILVVIDELADLMLTAPKDVEQSIQRLAQKARASGIHMVLATQRPSVDIITGVIKANLPCRLSFQVVSKHDSRTILDQMGAEKLLGKGDMLFQRPGTGRLERIQGALVSDEEVINLVSTIKEQGTLQYDSTIMSWIDTEISKQNGDEGDLDSPVMDDDPKFVEAVQIGKNYGVISASFLQRHLKIGYNRAARMVEFMETKGMVAKSDGTSRPRKWLG